MAWAIHRPHDRALRRSESVAQSDVEVAVRPIGAFEVGLLAALVGAWGAVCIFIGPYFGYYPTSQDTWAWTTQNWLLHLVPGATAFVGGLLILSASAVRRRTEDAGGASMGLAALLLVASGAWFVIGPALWATFESGQPFNAGTSAWDSFLNQVGSSLGPGIILAVLGGMAFKAVVARPRATVHHTAMVEDPTAMERPMRGSGVAEPTTVERPVRSSEMAEPTAVEPPVRGSQTAEPAAVDQPGRSSQTVEPSHGYSAPSGSGPAQAGEP
jgi:hypothetical protein